MGFLSSDPDLSAEPLTLKTTQEAVSCTDECSVRRSGLEGTASHLVTPESEAPALICEPVNLKIHRLAAALQDVHLEELLKERWSHVV